MLSFLPAPITAMLALLFLALNTFLGGIIFYALLLVRWLIPVAGVRKWCDLRILTVVQNWLYGVSFELWLLGDFKWNVRGLESLRRDASYLICANHQSWVDIVVLNEVLNRRIPLPRIFLKKQVLSIPIIGHVLRALDYPVIHRFSASDLRSDADKRALNLRATREVCERWQGKPVVFLNFLEGTRFSPEKHAEQNSPYRNLLRPKAGGVAVALEALGHQFKSLLNVTILYPNVEVNFRKFLCGQVREITIYIEEIPIPTGLLDGNYQDDTQFRSKVQVWINEIWERKDRLLTELKSR